MTASRNVKTGFQNTTMKKAKKGFEAKRKVEYTSDVDSVWPRERIMGVMSQKGYRKVVEEYDAGRVDASDPVVVQLVGTALLLSGDARRASDVLADVYGLMSDDVSFVSTYGASLRRCGDLNDALEVFDKFMKSHPDRIDSGLCNNYANLLIDLGKTKEAREILSGYKDLETYNIEDIRETLRRIERVESLHNSNVIAKDNVSDVHSLSPLSQAFSLEEILAYKNRTNRDIANEGQDVDKRNLAAEIQLPEINQKSTEMDVIRLLRQQVSSDPKAALELCKRYLNSFIPKAQIYQMAGDCYILLEEFAKARLCYQQEHKLYEDTYDVLEKQS